MLQKNAKVDYIGPVLIKINFSGDTLRVTSYNKEHCKLGSKSERAEEVINMLRLEAEKSHTMSMQCN